MDEDSDRSSEATQLEDFRAERRRAVDDDDDDVEDSGAVNGNEDDGDDDDDEEEEEEETDDQREASELESSPMEIQDELRTCQSETLVSGLADVPIHYEMRHDELERLKNQLQGSHQEALAIVIAQAAQAQSENKSHLPGVPSSCSELSTFCVTPISCFPRSNSQEQTPSPLNAVSNSVAEENQKITNSGPRTVSASRTARTPIDGFNWRKYGQKQVKSTQGSRSYYKCTYADCDAKKIESCDQHNSVTKIVYKGQHKHDPPKKVFTRRGRVVSTSSKALERKANSSHGSKQHKSGGSVSNGPIVIEEIDEPEPKQRVKKRASPSHVPALKPPKKPKFVIHASADVGISADGYRWRKYGQKAVKGNPHPRNYYKCTSTGCPVRKHIEMAMDGSSEVILTYKGVHDHEMPVGTEGHNGPLHLTASSKSKKREASSTRLTIKHSNGVGKKTTEESAFEVRPC